jgi:hypothetical protein
MTNEQAVEVIRQAEMRDPPLEVCEAMLVLLAAEREACARLCETLRGEGPVPSAGALDCARAIRARSKP